MIFSTVTCREFRKAIIADVGFYMMIWTGFPHPVFSCLQRFAVCLLIPDHLGPFPFSTKNIIFFLHNVSNDFLSMTSGGDTDINGFPVHLMSIVFRQRKPIEGCREFVIAKKETGVSFMRLFTEKT